MVVAGPPRFPATLLLIALSLLWFTTTIIFIFKQPPTQDHHHRILPPVRFDFSLFVSRRHHHRKIGRGPFVSWSALDPRYDVEKHLVPTGPNPLHH
ncbi:hypothetical protein SSX86_000120 [Deinandra increscens subsp. villosa]|uniref:CLAVATA3/ESR (CLE)-related protein 13 n=1 Tax=Deinandra increscens subsp. villosa TaxID=3103831 RepID=A0AAP0DWJ6_9ASTR